MTTDEWLNSLNVNQLDQVEIEIKRITEKRKSKVKSPGAASLNDLAENLGFDLSFLQKEISRK